MEAWLQQQWLKRGIFACALWPVSLLFSAVVALRRTLYRTGILRGQHAGIPTIIVGNLIVGGVGKTPLVIALAQSLKSRGFTPGIISRGYVKNALQAKNWVAEVKYDSNPQQVGDEPILLAQRADCPVFVGARRVAVAAALRQKHPDCDVLISDDGLQHYALKRDVEIAVFDNRIGGNGWLLPAGPLREPLSRRRDFSVLNCGTHATLQAPAGWFNLRLKIQHAYRLADLKNIDKNGSKTPHAALSAAVFNSAREKIVAMAGIGQPERFFTSLENAGLSISRHPLPDHFAFNENPFAAISPQQASVILITEKDAVKCTAYADSRVWVVPVDAQIEPSLITKIIQLLPK